MMPSLAWFALAFLQDPAPPAAPDARAILDAARRAVLEPVRAGFALTASVSVDVSRGDGRSMHLDGKLWSRGEEGGVKLRPTYDPRAPLGEASPATRIALEGRPGEIRWATEGRASWGIEPAARAFAAPESFETPFCLLVPPASWSELRFDVRRTRLDPHRLLSDHAGRHGHEQAAGDEFLVLLSEPRSRVDASRSGQVELWVRASSGVVERIALAFGPTGGSNDRDFVRAILSFRDVEFGRGP